MPSIEIVAEEFDCTVVKKERPHVRRHKKSEVEGGQKKREQDQGSMGGRERKSKRETQRYRVRERKETEKETQKEKSPKR